MSERLALYLRNLLQSDLPANVAAMRLLVEATSAEEAGAAVAGLRDGMKAGSPEIERLDAIAALIGRHPLAYEGVRRVLAEANHAGGGGADHWAGVFDRLAADAPDAAVALYALGSPELAMAAANEIVDWLALGRLINAHSRVLDLGCGVGRVSFALAPRVASVVGVDASAGMVAKARERAGSFTNVRFETTSGSDLAQPEEHGFDLVLAVDVFPYLVGAGGDLAGRHVAAAARILKTGGALAIFNYSYRGDDTLDQAEAAALFARNGFEPLVLGERPLRLWDGQAFVGRKR